MSGLIMSAHELAEEIRRFYSVQEYADDALAEVIADALGIGDDLQVVISIKKVDS